MNRIASAALAAMILSILITSAAAAHSPEPTSSAPVETSSAPVETASAPVETASAPVETESAPVETASIPVETPSGSIGTPVETQKPPKEHPPTMPPTDTTSTSSVSQRDVTGNGLLIIFGIIVAVLVFVAYLSPRRPSDD